MQRKTDGGLTALFVRRPVLAFVMNMLIVVAGLAAAFGVEIRELPDVDRPVITVSTDYPAAAAETIDRENKVCVTCTESVPSLHNHGNMWLEVEVNHT